MSTLIEQLAALGLLTGMTRSAPVYAFVSAAHVLGIALLLGPILLADLALLGRVRDIDAKALSRLRRTARLGLALAFVTGVLLLSARPDEYARNPVVWAKLAAVAAGAANALFFEWRARSGTGPMPAAIASMVLWLAALLLGRWIAFV